MAEPNISGKGGLFKKLFCDHDWVKRENWHQLDRSTGMIAWKCGQCGKVVKKPKTFSPGR